MMMMMQPYIFPWEHESVASVQEALHCGAQYGPSYAWHEAALLEAGEAEESRDLSSTSSTASSAPGWPDTALLPAPAAYSFSPPPAPPPAGRLVTLPPRPQLLEHHQLGGEQLQLGHHHLQPSTSLVKQEKERRVRARPRSAHEQKESVERPCRVCGERAGKHSYYGGQVRVAAARCVPCLMSRVQVCPSCRAFFRRSVQSGYNATYYCVKEGDCEVTLKTRKNCQYCRYRRCERAGMKTSWVLTEEERKLKFAGKGKKRKERAASGGITQLDPAASPAEAGAGQGAGAGLGGADLARLQRLVSVSGWCEVSRVADMDTQLIRKIIRMIAFKAALDPDGQAQLRSVLSSRSLNFVTKLEVGL